MDLALVRVRTARCFLDGFAQIREVQSRINLPIFAAMSPTDQASSAQPLSQPPTDHHGNECKEIRQAEGLILTRIVHCSGSRPSYAPGVKSRQTTRHNCFVTCAISN